MGRRTKWYPSKRMEKDIKRILNGTDFQFVGFTAREANTVGVVGDARIVGPAVIIKVPVGTTWDQFTEISTQLTNRVRGLVRVMIEIPTSGQH